MSQTDINILLNQIKNIEQGIESSENIVLEDKNLEAVSNALFKLSQKTKNADNFIHNILNDNFESEIDSNAFYTKNALELNTKLQTAFKHSHKLDSINTSNIASDFVEHYPFSFSDFINILDCTSEWIVAVDATTFEILHANEAAQNYFFSPKDSEEYQCGSSCMVFDYFSQMIEPEQEKAVFEYFCPFSEKRLLVKAFRANWNGNPAYITYVNDVTNEVRYQELAFSDELTGIFNRRYFIKKIKALLEENSTFSLAMIDMDGLKYANDTFGHAAGDTYIKSIVSAIKSAFIYNITFCRIGGDEFALISEKLNAHSIDEKLASVNLKFSKQDTDYPMSISFGTINVDSFESTYSELIKQADDIMYEHKRIRKANRKY